MKKIYLVVAVLVVLGISGVVAEYYFTSSEYLAAKALKEGEAALDRGDIELATKKLVEALNSETSAAADARTVIAKIMTPTALSARTPDDQLKLFYGFSDVTPAISNYASSLDQSIAALESSPFHAAALKVLLVNVVEDETAIQNLAEAAHAYLIAATDELAKFPLVAKNFALLDEQFDACEHCMQTLQPHIETLGDHEAARALGQYYARQSEVEKSFALLKPYTEIRLAAYLAAEQEYTDATNKVWDETIEYLNSGDAPESFYTAYEAADEAEKNALVDQVYSARYDKSAKIQDAVEKYQRASAIVPVALDLAIVRLGRALQMPDPAERDTELKVAEQIFLSVRSYAGDSDNYQLYLGQVYYWLGKEAEGKELFDALIDKYGRDYNILSSIASTLRDLGAIRTSKIYIEEAYENCPDQETKYAIAYQRSLLAEDYDDTLLWLERSNTNLAHVKASIFSTKASVAEGDGKDDKALKLYQKSIDAYGGMPENSSTLNNVSLVYSAKYRISRDEADLNGAIENIDKAVALSSDDAIVLSNAADLYKSRVFRKALAAKVDLDLLKYTPSMEMLGHFYGDESEKKQLLAAIDRLPEFKKLLDYTQKASLLSPKSYSAASAAYQLYYHFNMTSESESLLKRLSAIPVDLAAGQDSSTKYRSGEGYEDALKDINKAITLLSDRRQSVSQEKNSQEYHILTHDILSYELSKYHYDEVSNLEGLRNKIKALYRVSPSSKTRRLYVDVLETALVFELSDLSPTFEAMFGNYRRILSAQQLVELGAHTLPEFSSILKTSKILPDYLALAKETEASFPGTQSSSYWFLMHYLGDASSETIKQQYHSNPKNQLSSDISRALNVNKESQMLQDLSYALMTEDVDSVKKLIESVKENQLQLPVTWIY